MKFQRPSFRPLLFILSVILLATSCTDPEVKIATDPAFGAYISAYTAGIISSSDPIIVKLAAPYSGPLSGTEALPGNLFKFNPPIQGQAFWTDATTIRFQPTDPLKSGTLFTAKLDLSMLTKVEAAYKTFVFQFQTIEQDLSIYIDGFEPNNPMDLTRMSIHGKINTADVISTENLKDAFKASQGNTERQIQIESQSDKVYAFTVENVLRGEQRSELKLTWNLKTTSADVEGEHIVQIPSLSDFEVLSTSVSRGAEKVITVNFSDPIADQKLDAFITIEDIRNLQFVISGNKVEIYPNQRTTGSKLLTINAGIKNIAGHAMNNPYTGMITFEQEKPKVALLGNKAIIPSQESGLIFPFEAVSLSAVDVYITKVFTNNVLQYFQDNDLGGNNNLNYVGRYIYRKHIDLRQTGGTDLLSMNRYYIDLSEVVKVDPGALYQVDIRFKKEYALFDCLDEENTEKNVQTVQDGWLSDGTYFVDDYWDDYEYNWEEEDNPCHNAYYSRWNTRAQRIVMATNLGVTAKMGGNKELLVVVNDMRTTKPVSGAVVEVFDLQQQLIAEQTTDLKGFTSLTCERVPFAVVVKSGAEVTYLKVDQGSALSLSKFEVAGSQVQDGVKGFIYGERGVWRPGDSLYLNFMLEDPENILPKSHPVKMELYNPLGQMVNRIIKTNSVNGFYDFRTRTDTEDPTGDYQMKVSVGNRTYSKTLKIETVKPNRLKIQFEFEKIVSAAKSLDGKLSVAWLHGATAGNLKADIAMTLRPTATKFDKYDQYYFENNILRQFYSEEVSVFDGKLDEEGNASLQIDMEEMAVDAPGMLKASFNTKVYEPGGDFSVDFYSVNYAPYESFAGLKIPESEMWANALETDQKHQINLVSLDASGKLTDRKELNVKVFRINNRWWYDRYDGYSYDYLTSSNYNKVEEEKVKLTNGKGAYSITIPKASWGRYLIMVEDEVSGHSAASFVYFDWPYWMRANRTDSEASTILGFSSDKEKYGLGESVKLTFPSPENGRALVCIENGTKILDKFWVETEKGETKVEFKTTAEMAPNVFAHITLLQPHAQTVNDRPIRMFGIVPILVENPDTRLQPVILSSEVFRPETKEKISVKEENGRAMTYTLALVDEGLLGLTRFQTPDPWNSFYAREALGVKTWDMYDQVVGAFTDGSGKVLSIGGDEEGTNPSKQKAVRFTPVVRFLGPFTLKAGATATHEIQIPNYVGAVRAMVVAGKDQAYGNAQKEIPVRSPLMVLGTLPRVLGPGEKVSLPVNVFALEPQVKNVKISVKTNDLISISGGNSREMTFTKMGDDIAFFQLETGMKTGIGKVSITATSGNERSFYEVEVDVRPPNPTITTVKDVAIEPGKSWESEYAYFGIAGTNKGVVEVSKLPAINLEKRLDYLIQYPHGCVEQTVSSAFPQLFLEKMLDLNSDQKIEIENNVKSALRTLRNFQTSSGGFGYWPGNQDANPWGTSYAGHFMLEAEAKGYVLPAGLKSQWLRYQKSEARRWSSASNKSDPYMQRMQAYRLYTLARATEPDFGAMNLLKSQTVLHISSRWILALAYVEAGQPEVASGLIKGQVKDIPTYTELSYTYGSDLRDEAFVLHTLVKLRETSDAALVAKSIAETMGSDRWYSTQTVAFSLEALAMYMGDTRDNGLKVKLTENGKSKDFATARSLIQENLSSTVNKGSFTLVNNSEQTLFARLILSGKPLESNEQRMAKNLKIEVRYLDNNLNSIDVSKLKMGTDFIAEVKITNPGTRGYLEELALTQGFPSGWEILNPRMSGGSSLTGTIPDYQDIRDDKVMTYFDIESGKSITFKMRLNATYKGRFYLPATVCNAMYDESIMAVEPGMWVEVVE